MSKGVALITGASGGIGGALARCFAVNDFDLVITARREAELNALAEALGDQARVSIVVADLSTADGIRQLTDGVEALGVDIDVLVNNAAIAGFRNFTQLSRQEMHDLVNLNCTAVSTLMHHFLPGMVARGSGRILNVASVGAFQPIPGMSLYAASKAFVLSLSEGVTEELRGTGVSVTALCPGVTRADPAQQLEVDVPDFLVGSADEVARQAYEAVMSRQAICVPGLVNQAGLTWAKFQPRWLTRGLAGFASRFAKT